MHGGKGSGGEHGLSASADDRMEPVLATSDQETIEKTALTILARPDVESALKIARAFLRNDPASGIADGQRMLERAASFWLADLAMRKAADDPARPRIALTPTARPRHWFGHVFPGSGTGGDSPDNILRTVSLHGRHRYVLRGLVPRNRSAQFTLSLQPELRAKFGLGKPSPLPYNPQLAMLRDEDLHIDAQGQLEITLDAAPADGRSNHMQLPQARVDLWLRESLSDWRQKPTRWTIARVDSEPAPPARDADTIASDLLADYPDWVRYWARFKESFFDRPVPNTLAGPMHRKGGWGYLSFGFFDLKDDEGLLAVIDNAGARYSSIQALDPWYLALDAANDVTARNNGQTQADPDGAATFVISRTDPGTPNWISTGGLRRGIVLVRQQGIHEDAVPAIRTYRLVRLSELPASLPAGTPVISAEQRQSEIAARRREFELRYQH